jgi:hypothetical protein
MNWIVNGRALVPPTPVPQRRIGRAPRAHSIDVRRFGPQQRIIDMLRQRTPTDEPLADWLRRVGLGERISASGSGPNSRPSPRPSGSCKSSARTSASESLPGIEGRRAATHCIFRLPVRRFCPRLWPGTARSSSRPSLVHPPAWPIGRPALAASERDTYSDNSVLSSPGARPQAPPGDVAGPSLAVGWASAGNWHAPLPAGARTRAPARPARALVPGRQ